VCEIKASEGPHSGPYQARLRPVGIFLLGSKFWRKRNFIKSIVIEVRANSLERINSNVYPPFAVQRIDMPAMKGGKHYLLCACCKLASSVISAPASTLETGHFSFAVFAIC